MLEVKQLSKSFGSKEVLQKIDLELAPGGIYGIVGANGSGKTTLFRCLAGLEAYEGTINAPVQPFKNSLGLLLAETYFFSRMTGREYLRLLCSARGVVEKNLDQRNIFELPLDQYVSTYSTGMQKKLAFLGILLQKNQYFILDEPFNGVDIQSNILFQEILLELKSLGKTILLSSHIFSTLSQVCDQIYWLKEGSMVQAAQKEEFSQLEEALREVVVGRRLEQLGLV
jgi:ABC-2 type transport system ATP-binding protein